MFLLCWAGRDHTDAVGLHVACIRAYDGNGDVSIVNMEEGRDGMNNEREEGGRKRKKGQLVPRLVLVKDD